MNPALVAAAAWSLSTAPAASPPIQPLPTNGDFSRAEGGAPLGWIVNRRNGSDPGVRLTLTGEGTARLSPDGIAAGQWTRLVQRIDAAPWRGKLVRLSARVRVIDPGDHVGLRLSVERPNGLFGYYDQMADSPLAAGDWRTVSLTGVVEPDATAIEIGAMIGGRAEIEIDDVVLQEMEESGAPVSPEARAYLDAAIRIVRERHMDSSRHDWAALTARAYRQAAGAATTRDTYPAIRGILSAMGDNHSFFRPPPRSSATAGAAANARPRQPLPQYALLDGRFGLVRIPALAMLGEADRPHGQTYLETLRAGLLALDRRRLCGWIVDLRGNGGGNMWPMLNGMAPLLGRPPFGAFVRPGGETTRWTLQPGVGLVTVEGRDMREMGLRMSPFRLRQAERPVAVLIGPDTASSGEAVAIALAGRPRSRSFGRPSGGYTSANGIEALPDGAILGIPVSWEADRTGREYRAAIVPDEPVEDGAELAAAQAWLSGQCRTEERE